MNNDGDAVFGFLLGLGAMVVILPAVAAASVVVVAAKGLTKAATAAYGLIQDQQAKREIRHVVHERDAAIKDIVALRNEGERRMREVGQERRGRAEQW
jgi:hypothetical protein